MSPVPCVITDSTARVRQQPTAGTPAPRREAGPPRCPFAPHSHPQPLFQPSEPPSRHIPTLRSSPPRRSHQTGLKVNNSLSPARSRIRVGTAQMGSVGRERVAGKASKTTRGHGGNAGGTHGQRRATGTSSLPGAMPKSTALLQPCFTFPQCPLLHFPRTPPRRLCGSLPRCSELAASPRRVPSCPACLQGTEGAL